MSLSANKARLGELTKNLLVHWDDTRNQWRDAKSADFEARYLRDLKSDVDKAMGAMDEMEKLLAKMRRDCE